jgi:linoleate 10R-lipoxygenase
LPFKRAAAALYHDIDNLELYVGLQAEQAKKPQPGAGLCPGFTISRAILSDAVALTRGDRFLTVDFTRMQLSSVLS